MASGPDTNTVNSGGVQPNVNPGLFPVTWPVTYNGAVSAFNQLLSDLGTQMNAVYVANKGTYVSTEDIFNAIKNAGYNVSYKVYNVSSIVSTLKNGNLIIQTGAPNTDGHAWVIDGYSYKSIKESVINECYLYCHWGWFGIADGWYYADVFNPAHFNFVPYLGIVVSKES